MRNSYDYIEGRLAEQRSAAELRRRVAAARRQNHGTDRFGVLQRLRPHRGQGGGGCTEE